MLTGSLCIQIQSKKKKRDFGEKCMVTLWPLFLFYDCVEWHSLFHPFHVSFLIFYPSIFHLLSNTTSTHSISQFCLFYCHTNSTGETKPSNDNSNNSTLAIQRFGHTSENVCGNLRWHWWNVHNMTVKTFYRYLFFESLLWE